MDCSHNIVKATKTRKLEHLHKLNDLKFGQFFEKSLN